MSGTNDNLPISHEDLVAYLDGELEAEAARRVEERLRVDEKLREELRRLQQSWDLLANLPQMEAEPALAKSTVEMLAVEAAADLARKSQRLAWRRRLSWGLAAGTLFVAGFLGVVAAERIWPDADAPLLRNLPVIRDFDAYQQAGNIDFLREVHARDLFATDGRAGGDPLRPSVLSANESPPRVGP